VTSIELSNGGNLSYAVAISFAVVHMAARLKARRRLTDGDRAALSKAQVGLQVV
jgi:hypothetical protein